MQKMLDYAVDAVDGGLPGWAKCNHKGLYKGKREAREPEKGRGVGERFEDAMLLALKME